MASFRGTTVNTSRLIVAISRAENICGVEAFSRLTAKAAGQRGEAVPLDSKMLTLAARLGPHARLVLNLPIVAWKAKLVELVAAGAAARVKGAGLILVLHEWTDLDWKRRVSYVPLLPLATGLAFSAPEVAEAFAASPASRIATVRRTVVPVPSNLFRPEMTMPSALSERLAAERANGRFVIGHFGSIYPKKQSTVVLDVAAELVARGEDPFVVFVGSFVSGERRLEADFHCRINSLGLTDRVAISGYVACEAEVFGLFDEVDVFLYAFSEGLTARRSSVQAVAASGKPVVVNAPAKPGGFDHHPTYRRLIEAGLVRLVPHGAEAGDLAAAVSEARAVRPTPVAIEKSAAWADVVAALDRLAS